MAEITLTIPNEHVPRVLLAFERAGNERLDGENDLAFGKRVVRKFIIDTVFQTERRAAKAAVTVEEGLVDV